MIVRQAANVLEILEYFAKRLKPATPAEIAGDLGWPRSSTFKLVGTLAAKGYLYEPRGRGSYYPSPRWLVLAEAVTRAEPLPERFQRLARDVMEATGETTAISAPAGIFATFVDVAESRQPVRYFARVGDRVPIHASSAGRALLAQLSADERERLYRKIDFTLYSPTTPASAEAVEVELKHAAKRGWHQSNAEYTPDLAGVALPLPGSDRNMSVVVVGPVSRCLERRPEMAAIVARHLAAL
ncbi:IclR family transcriptional regulator [Sphingosinicella soli]|uniref:DNA-binding IclR family transcriptional regulator n=1 Tax=Sphingosinicella soli TaxID=333708 RepID=A0A7W7F4Z4_9SPHN|nr:IclR family transcriptional regulator [Sphingosinicella soli]MBB4630860.1 DNA-binding IclR family transcriptional regulator [Sphingosinicella soli]